jgi:hypothetical protein
LESPPGPPYMAVFSDAYTLCLEGFREENKPDSNGNQSKMAGNRRIWRTAASSNPTLAIAQTVG